MRLAVWESRLTPSIHEADAVLDRIRITDQDVPWLNDIRTLARRSAGTASAWRTKSARCSNSSEQVSPYSSNPITRCSWGS
jgi:hypothetical protein